MGWTPEPNWRELNMLAYVLLVFLAASVGMMITVLIAKHHIYRKAGQRGWAAFVPFYTTFTLYKITWGNGWVFLAEFIPVVGCAFVVLTQIKLAHNFEKGTGFILGLVFLHPFFLMALGFGQSRYLGIVKGNICNFT